MAAIHPSWHTTPPPRRRRARIGVLATIPSPAPPTSDPLAELPPVGRAVARLFAEGWACADIAGALGIAEHTVRSHLTDAYKTLGIDGTAHAASRILAYLVGGWASRCAERESAS